MSIRDRLNKIKLARLKPTEEYKELLRYVELKVNQKPLIGVGIPVKKLKDGTECCVGDMISISELIPPYEYTLDNGKTVLITNAKKIGILVLMLDRGVCLLSNKLWFNVNISISSNDQWELIHKYKK